MARKRDRLGSPELRVPGVVHTAPVVLCNSDPHCVLTELMVCRKTPGGTWRARVAQRLCRDRSIGT